MGGSYFGLAIYYVSFDLTTCLCSYLPYVLLNFLPWQTQEETRSMLVTRFGKNGNGKTAKEALVGLFPEKLIGTLLTEAGIHLESKAENCTQEELEKLISVIRHLRVDITGTKGFDAAQVTAGGVDTEEIDGNTMEIQTGSRDFDFAGEVVDIDGMCGG